MRISIDDYSYVYVKLAVLKSVVMNAQDESKIKSLSDLDSLAIFLERYFPGFHPNEKTILGFERALWEVYFRILEKIFLASPDVIQSFIKTVMVKHEITSIKVAIMGVIAQVPTEIKNAQIYDKPSEMLDRSEFLRNLIHAKNLDDVVRIAQKTPYEKIIEEGVEKYKKTSEIFYLEQALDKNYYSNLFKETENYPEPEKQFIERYVETNLDYYNLNIIFRALYNHIPMEIIKDYLIPNGFLFKEAEIKKLITSDTIDSFLENLKVVLKPHKQYSFVVEELAKLSPEALEKLAFSLLQEFVTRYQRDIIEDIPLTTIYRIFRIVFHKEIEIKEALARAVQITLAIQS